MHDESFANQEHQWQPIFSELRMEESPDLLEILEHEGVKLEVVDNEEGHRIGKLTLPADMDKIEAMQAMVALAESAIDGFSRPPLINEVDEGAIEVTFYPD